MMSLRSQLQKESGGGTDNVLVTSSTGSENIYLSLGTPPSRSHLPASRQLIAVRREWVGNGWEEMGFPSQVAILGLGQEALV